MARRYEVVARNAAGSIFSGTFLPGLQGTFLTLAALAVAVAAHAQDPDPVVTAAFTLEQQADGAAAYAANCAIG